jgi:iron complex transport system substrate-binding protein
VTLVFAFSSPSAFGQDKARRWVSLSPSITEVLFDLGAGPEVVGVCAPADYPPEAKDRKTVASWEKVDIEAILILRPSACFTVEGMQGPEALLALRRLGVEVKIYPMRDLDDLWSCLRGVGGSIGRAKEAEARIRTLKERIALAVRDIRGPAQRGAVVVGLAPLVAAGRASFLNKVLSLCRIENVLTAWGEAYPSLSLEQLASAQPRLVVLPEGEIPKPEAERFLRSLEDVQGERVRGIWVPADLLVRPGPRTAEAVEIIAKARREGGSP